MARPKQTKEQITAMRERILDAAAELLHQQGPQALSIRAITKRLGISPMALYTYFENRAALFAALSERHRGQMRERHAELLRRAQTGDVREAVRESLAFFPQMAHERPRVYQFLWVLSMHEGCPLTPHAGCPSPRHRRLKHILGRLSQLVQLGMERGVFVSRDPLLAAATAFSIVNAPLFLYHSGRLQDAALRDQIAEEALNAAMNYLSNEMNTSKERK